MFRLIVHGLLITALLLTGCQHEFWHISEHPIDKSADKFARWLERHPKRWINHHQEVIQDVQDGVMIGMLVAGLLYADYIVSKKEGQPMDLSWLFSND
jgi:hypothetical protein